MKPNMLIACVALVLVGVLLPPISATPITNTAPTPYSTKDEYFYPTYFYPSEILAENGTLPVITMSTPTNNTVVKSNNLTLTFNLTLETPANHSLSLQGLCYKPSWEPDNITVDVDSSNPFNNTLPFSITFSNLTDGEKSVTIYASVMYQFESKRVSFVDTLIPHIVIIGGQPSIASTSGRYLNVYTYYYFTEGSSSVNFTIDSSPTMAPTSEFITLIGIVAGEVTVAIVSLIYFKRHARKLKWISQES